MKDIQQFQLYDKYLRTNPDGTRETWNEAVVRVVDFLRGLSGNKLDNQIYQDISDAIYNFEIMPSMRLLATAGPAATRNNLALYNCSSVACNDIRVFGETLYLSMHGVGVGYSVERQFVNQLPVVPELVLPIKEVFLIPDTTEGWKEAIDVHINNLYVGKVIKFDYSVIRPAGSILKVKGGFSSGPEVLEELIDFITEKFLQAQGRKLTTLEVHDIMCSIGGAAVAGGSRRSAMLSLFSPDDTEMLRCKSPENIKGNGTFENPEHRYRWNANNSMAFEEELTAKDLLLFSNELFGSGTGEPGIYSRYNARKNAPERRNKEKLLLVNPCQPDFATVLTPDGIRRFRDIEVGSTIWSGKQWTTVVNKVMTGIKPVYKYHSTFGTFIGTENHQVFQKGERVEVKDAETIDACAGQINDAYHLLGTLDPQDIIDGLVVGDGGLHKGSNNLVLLYIGDKDTDYFGSEIKNLIIKKREGINPKAWEIETTIEHTELPRTYERYVPKRFYHGDAKKVRGFLRGIYTANGSITGDRISLKQTSYELIKQVQDMLSSVGIRSYVTVNKPAKTKWHNGIYESKQSYNLNISTDKWKFMESIGFIQKYKTPKRPVRKNNLQTGIIKEVEYIGDLQVYDITVSADEHSYWSGGLLVSNCGEVGLRDMGLCNLTCAIVRNTDFYNNLANKVQIAAIIGTIQSMAIHFPNMRPEWEQNAREERLLGVDITGQMDNKELISDETLMSLKELVVATNKHYAKILGIEQSVATTCLKPSGNTSVLVDSASGIHPRYAKYYLRNVQLFKHSNLYVAFSEQGVPMLDFPGDENRVLVQFPMKSPENSVTRHDVSAWDMLNHWKKNAVYYAEHNPSVTVYYKENEIFEIVQWLWENKDVINGIAFFPAQPKTYPFYPLHEITKEEYLVIASEFPDIDWSVIVNGNINPTFECAGGVCDII